MNFTIKILLLITLPIITIFFTTNILQTKSDKEMIQMISNEYQNNMNETYTEHLKIKSEDIKKILLGKVDLIYNELKILAGSAQTLIDEDSLKNYGKNINNEAFFKNDFQYNSNSNIVTSFNNISNTSVYVYGYLHNDGIINKTTNNVISQMNPLKYTLHNIKKYGIKKGWTYYVGPKESPIAFISSSYNALSDLETLYPGFNETNYWDFFFPGMVEGWNKWIQTSDFNSTVSKKLITQTPLYKDAAGSGLMVSYFHPLWNKLRTKNNGAVAIDYKIENLINLLNTEKVGHNGFSLLIQSDGNILNITEEYNDILGIKKKIIKSNSIEETSYNLKTSKYNVIQNLAKNINDDFTYVRFEHNNEKFLITFQKILDYNLWNGSDTIKKDALYLSLVLSEKEIYDNINKMKIDINSKFENQYKTNTIISFSLLLIVILLAILLSLKFTKQIRLLDDGMEDIKNKKFDNKISVVDSGELGKLTKTFNNMMDEIKSAYSKLESYAQLLETKVKERTKEIEDKNKQLEILSITDNLTQIYNRNKIDDVLNQLYKKYKRNSSTFGLMIFDIDFFKKVNDNYGHSIGDKVLVEFVNTIKNEIREIDIFGRWGGEEFILIVEDTNEDRIFLLAEKVRKSIENNVFSEVKNITASVGIATINEVDTIESLIIRADDGLYQSKDEGRNKSTLLS